MGLSLENVVENVVKLKFDKNESKANALETIKKFLYKYYSEVSMHKAYKKSRMFLLEPDSSDRNDGQNEISYLVYGGIKKAPPNAIAYEEYADVVPLSLIYEGTHLGFINIRPAQSERYLRYSVQFSMINEEYSGKKFSKHQSTSVEEARGFYNFVMAHLIKEVQQTQ